MGLYRYLRRKFNLQQLSETCESTHEIADKCLKEICTNGGGIQTKLDEVIQNERQLRESGGLLTAKADETIASQKQQKEIGNRLISKADLTIAAQQQLKELHESSFRKAGEILESQHQLGELCAGISSKADVTIAGQKELRESGAFACAKLDQVYQISAVIRDVTNEIDFSGDPGSSFPVFTIGKRTSTMPSRVRTLRKDTTDW